VHEVGVDGREIVAMLERAEHLLAHGDQRLGAAGRQVEPAQQLLTTRFGGRMYFRRSGIARPRAPSLNRRVEPGIVRPEPGRKRLKECDPRAGGHVGVARQNLTSERHAGGFPASRQELFAQLDQGFGPLGGVVVAAAPALDQRATTLGNRLQQLAEE